MLLVSLTPWMETIAQRSFTGHMIQHVVMISVPAPLVVLARPLKTILPLGSMPPKLRRVMHASSRTWHRSAAILAPAMFIVVLIATHLTGVYDAALRRQWVHDAEHVAYLISASALWALMLAPGRRHGPVRVAGMFAVIAGMAFLGTILLTADRALIDTYEELHGSSRALGDREP